MQSLLAPSGPRLHAISPQVRSCARLKPRLRWSARGPGFPKFGRMFSDFPPVDPDPSPHLPAKTCRNTALQLEANMGEVIRFIPKAERERTRLIREARALYDGIFPPSGSANEQRDNTP